MASLVYHDQVMIGDHIQKVFDLSLTNRFVFLPPNDLQGNFFSGKIPVNRLPIHKPNLLICRENRPVKSFKPYLLAKFTLPIRKFTCIEKIGGLAFGKNKA